MQEKNKLKFPEGFLWGAATSAYQVEGNLNNDWIQWEKDNAERLAKNANKKWKKWQQEKFPEMFDPQNYISGRACDHYNRYEEDFDLAKAGGHNAHRFSIEWSRIEPSEGKFDEKEIEHYRKVILALRARGMEPFVTLWHWTEPIWFQEKGGWQSVEAVKYFTRFVEKIVSELKNEVKFWIVINEPNVSLGFGHFLGSQPPAKRGPINFLRAYFHILKSYRESYDIIHKISSYMQVGFANSFAYYKADVCKIFNGIITKVVLFFSRYFFNNTKGCNDFIGLNYYSRNLIAFKRRNLSEDYRTDLGWEIYPEGIYEVLKELKKYNLPVYITENGLADARDKYRADFIKEHLKYIQKAINDGMDIRGYFYWSLLDNFEFPDVRGFWPRFGLIEIDYKTLERKPRKSFYFYKEVIKSNGLKYDNPPTSGQ